MTNSTLTKQIPDWTKVEFEGLSEISILYCRLSSEDANEGESNSISNQRLILSKLAERENLSNPIVFYDDGYSGSNAQRPAFQQALALVKNNQVSNFVVKDLSRVSRDYLLSGNLLEVVFPSKNIRFISLQENIDSNKKSSQDAYLTPLVSLFNNWYSMQCSEKIKLSKHTKAKNGEKIGWITPYGYLNNPENRKEWLVDEYASEIVKRIFSEYISGRTPTEIAQGLRCDKILTPARYKMNLGVANYRILESDPCYWKTQMIWQILEKEEYIGSTINLKTAKISYKQRNCRMRPREDWLIFPDSHEAIISKEDFEIARKMMGHKRVIQRQNWKNKSGHENLFAGLLYCENGHKLSFCPQEKAGVNLDHYKCYHFKRAGDTCSGGHYLRKELLENLILNELQELINSFQINEADLLQRLKDKFEIKETKKFSELKKQLTKNEQRMVELDIIIQKLYEKQLLGEIADDRFKKLCDSYEAEQAELKEKVQTATETLGVKMKSAHNIEKFMTAIRKYTQLEKLTPKIINELIDKIIVHQPIGRGKNRQIKLEIHYRFIGDI